MKKYASILLFILAPLMAFAAKQTFRQPVLFLSDVFLDDATNTSLKTRVPAGAVIVGIISSNGTLRVTTNASGVATVQVSGFDTNNLNVQTLTAAAGYRIDLEKGTLGPGWVMSNSVVFRSETRAYESPGLGVRPSASWGGYSSSNLVNISANGWDDSNNFREGGILDLYSIGGTSIITANQYRVRAGESALEFVSDVKFLATNTASFLSRVSSGVVMLSGANAGGVIGMTPVGNGSHLPSLWFGFVGSSFVISTNIDLSTYGVALSTVNGVVQQSAFNTWATNAAKVFIGTPAKSDVLTYGSIYVGSTSTVFSLGGTNKFWAGGTLNP